MNKDKIVTIIVPIFNVKKYIKRCVDSIINQTYSHIEIILVDDGSTDGSERICDNYAKKDKRIVVIHKKNGGLSDARNVGIKKAKGDYLCFVDGDDSIENDAIEYLLNLLKKSKSDISIGKINIIKDGRNKNLPAKTKEKVLNKVDTMRLYLIDTISTSSCAKLYKRHLFDDIEFPVGKIYEDNGTTYKMIDNSKKIVLSNKVVYNYFINKNTITTKKISSQNHDLIELTDMMFDELGTKYLELYNYMVARKIHARFKIINKYFECRIFDDKKIDDYINFIKQNRQYIKYTDPKKKIAIRLLLANKTIYAKLYAIIKK